MAATQAAEISDKDVRVIPTKSIPQGITCITMFNSEHEVDENEAALMEALELVKTGSVTYAVRDTEMDGIEIKEGNMLGLIEGKINKVGDDYFTVAEGILESMVDEDSELITIFYGKDVDENKIEEFTEKLEELKAEFDCVTERRGKGLMQGLVITKPIKEINDRAIEEGLLIIQAQGNVIRFVPPLIVEKEHIDQMVEKMRRILA